MFTLFFAQNVLPAALGPYPIIKRRGPSNPLNKKCFSSSSHLPVKLYILPLNFNVSVVLLSFDKILFASSEI